MQEQDPNLKMPQGLSEMESAFGKLRPIASAINSAELMFRAGAASTRRKSVFWPALSVVLAIALTASLTFRPGAGTAERIVYVQVAQPVARQLPSESPDGAGMTPADGNYLKLRDDVLAKGLEALPKPSPLGKEASDDDVRGIMRQLGSGGRAGPAL